MRTRFSLEPVGILASVTVFAFAIAISGCGGGSSRNANLFVTPTNQNVGDSAGTAQFAVFNTEDYTTMVWTAVVTQGSEWLTISGNATGIYNNGVITASFSENTTGVTRIGTITITAPDADGSPKNVTVTQAAVGQPILAVKPDSQEVADTGGIVYFTVSNTNVGTTMNWSATASIDWLHITGGSSGINDGTITVNVDPNNSTKDRTGYIVVNAPSSINSPMVVTITQPAP